MYSSKEDGTYYNQFSRYFTTLYGMIHKKGGNALQGLWIKRARDDLRRLFNSPQASLLLRVDGRQRSLKVERVEVRTLFPQYVL